MVVKKLGKFGKSGVPFLRPGKFGENGIFGQGLGNLEFHEHGQQIICRMKIQGKKRGKKAAAKGRWKI